MKVKLEWWGSTFTPENDDDKRLLNSLVESMGSIDTLQPYYAPDDCIYWRDDSLVIDREGARHG